MDQTYVSKHEEAMAGNTDKEQLIPSEHPPPYDPVKVHGVAKQPMATEAGDVLVIEAPYQQVGTLTWGVLVMRYSTSR